MVRKYRSSAEPRGHNLNPTLKSLERFCNFVWHPPPLRSTSQATPGVNTNTDWQYRVLPKYVHIARVVDEGDVIT